MHTPPHLPLLFFFFFFCSCFLQPAAAKQRATWRALARSLGVLRGSDSAVGKEGSQRGKKTTKKKKIQTLVHQIELCLLRRLPAFFFFMPRDGAPFCSLGASAQGETI